MIGTSQQSAANMDLKTVMNVTGADRASALTALTHHGGDITGAINELLDKVGVGQATVGVCKNLFSSGN